MAADDGGGGVLVASFSGHLLVGALVRAAPPPVFDEDDDDESMSSCSTYCSVSIRKGDNSGGGVFVQPALVPLCVVVTLASLPDWKIWNSAELGGKRHLFQYTLYMWFIIIAHNSTPTHGNRAFTHAQHDDERMHCIVPWCTCRLYVCTATTTDGDGTQLFIANAVGEFM